MFLAFRRCNKLHMAGALLPVAGLAFFPALSGATPT